MAKSDDKPAKDAPAKADAAEATTAGDGTKAAAAAQPQIQLDESNVSAGYSNFCRVSSTPEELILDLGLNPNPYAQEGTTVKVSQRIIMNHYTAKRLLSALSMALQRHEQAFGVLETDVRKRVKQSPTTT